MLNGKFYTGLPPRMINRSNSTTTNRLESHFYWPDDTDTETAEETRVRRRASLSMTPAANKPVLQKQNSHNEASNEVNTKQMLHNQFSKSSIQFFDNIYEEEEQQKQQPLARHAKKAITCKPTATKMELPDSQSNADAAAIKNKHMFESKLEFNDFNGDDLNNRNNMRRNKIDMNDKLEMERNSKNSPKLQNKNNVQNLIEKNRWRAESELRENTHEDEERELQRKGRAKSVEFRNRNNNKYRRDQTPKRILKGAIRNGVDYSHYPECRDEDLYNEAADQVDEAFKHMKINSRRPILKKRVSYSEEEEEIPVRHYYNRHYDDDNDDDDDDLYRRKQKNQYKNRPSHGKTEWEQRAHDNLEQDQHYEEKQNISINHNKINDNNATTNVFGKSFNNNNNNNRILNVAQKHLRSSLCFHDGEIVGSDSEATSSTSGGTAQRRNARSTATQRVSVGLPD